LGSSPLLSISRIEGFRIFFMCESLAMVVGQRLSHVKIVFEMSKPSSSRPQASPVKSVNEWAAALAPQQAGYQMASGQCRDQEAD
jgi:hypothetical protein